MSRAKRGNYAPGCCLEDSELALGFSLDAAAARCQAGIVALRSLRPKGRGVAAGVWVSGLGVVTPGAGAEADGA